MIQDIRESITDDLLEVVRQKLHCTYISDLRNEPNNSFARQILSKINLAKYSLRVLNDTCNYIYCSKFDFHSHESAIAFIRNSSN